jgi:hypothetical protein
MVMITNPAINTRTIIITNTNIPQHMKLLWKACLRPMNLPASTPTRMAVD